MVAAAAAVVEQGIDGFLQHPLFVADDDVRRAQFHQPLQAVVPVDHAAVEIVEVGRRETAAIERHQRAQVRRDHRHDLHDHPFRAVAGLEEASTTFRRLASFLGFSSTSWLGKILAQFARAALGRSIDISISRIASAPIMAVKLSSPNSS
jgi:hypothetical protein